MNGVRLLRCSIGLVVGVSLVAAGCQDGPAESTEEAYLRLLTACEKDDAARLFDALDTATQWSVESVQRDQREMRRLITESYPPGDRERALSRIPTACEEPVEHPRRYFRRLDGVGERLAEIKRRMFAGFGQPIGTVHGKAGDADVWRAGGSIFHFARDGKGRWGWSELSAEWEQAKLRAAHDLETVRENAALYRGQAAPSRGRSD